MTELKAKKLVEKQFGFLRYLYFFHFGYSVLVKKVNLQLCADIEHKVRLKNSVKLLLHFHQNVQRFTDAGNNIDTLWINVQISFFALFI